MNLEPHPRKSLTGFLAINRTVGVVLIAVLFFGLGEELWSQFMPVYLNAEARHPGRGTGEVGWAVLWRVGVYACCRNLFEGFCYIGGGQMTARLGDRGSLLLFALLTITGYVLFLGVSTGWAAIVAAILILGWEPLSVPVTFTTVGSTLDPTRQGMAFAVQSIQKRLPKILGPALAGLVLGAAERALGSRQAGDIAGMRILVASALVLGLVSLAIQLRWMPHRKVPPPGPPAGQILRQLHPILRRLLVAEIFTRWCDWLVREFVVLYVVVVRGATVEEVGGLLAIQNLTALLTYLPVGRMTRTAGLQPFIGVTFIFFALFPLVLALVPSGGWLVLAFVTYGLREIGEPARKALITSLMPEEVRARGVGLYWGLRSFAICSASLAGAGLWYWLGPQALLYTACTLGVLGAAVFYLFCREPPSESVAHELWYVHRLLTKKTE
jgi:predicted MFS family arabinose efflux permease